MGVLTSAPALTIGPGWEALRDRLDRGTALVIGSPGLGKSHLVRFLAAEWAARGRRVGLLSADMGQAMVGPPACQGLALAPPWQEAAALWFVGDTTPTGNLLPAVVGAARLAERARREGAEVVLIDTTGLAVGPLARVLKYHKALAVGADHVVAVQRDVELEPLLAMLEGPCPAIHRLAPVAPAFNRDPLERKASREARFLVHLQGGAVVDFPPARLIGLDWAPDPLSRGQFPTPGTVVGLLDHQGFCLALGVIEEARPSRLAVYTAWRNAQAVNRVQLGRLRLSRQGEELT
jgi:polynucleotide 5'-hydroxyl-kinase GRC3/NOL9